MVLNKHLGEIDGRTFFVGDIHGCYHELMSRLYDLKFDVTKDRLIAVGDLVDRGYDSLRCIRLLKEPWFHSVIGNHELMCKHQNSDWHISNGGRWFREDLTQKEQQEVIELIDSMPLTITVETEYGDVMVVHADVRDANVVYNAENIFSDEEIEERLIPNMVWSRNRITYNETSKVDGVEIVVVGHTPDTHVRQLGNVFFIDTGCVFGEIYYLFVGEIDDIISSTKKSMNL